MWYQCWNDVKQFWKTVVSTLCVLSTLYNVENPTSESISFSTSEHRYFNVDPQSWNNVDPTLKCYFIQKASKANIFVKHRQGSKNNIINQHFYYLQILLATARWYRCGFSCFFVTTFCNGFARTEKKYVKVTDDGTYNRIMEFKANNEIIKMNRNYSNFDEKLWRVICVHEHHAYDKNNAGDM